MIFMIFYIPLEVGFNAKFARTTKMKIFLEFYILFIIVDIVLTLNKTIIIMGEREKNRLLIINKYLREDFVLDMMMIASVILEVSQLEGLLGLITLCYLVAIVKLIRVLTKLENVIVMNDVQWKIYLLI